MNPIQFKKISKELFYKNIDEMSQHFWQRTIGYFCDHKESLTDEEQEELLLYFKDYAMNLKKLEAILIKYRPIG